MPTRKAPPTVPPHKILDFLQRTEPFDKLDPICQHGLAARAQIGFYPQGTKILRAGRSRITHLIVVFDGSIKVFLQAGDGVESFAENRRQGQSVGALGIFRDSLSNLEVEAVEDTVCLEIAREDFLELIRNNARFTQYFLKFISESYVGRALAELRGVMERPAHSEGSLYLFNAQVGDVVRHRPVVVPEQTSVQRAAEAMTSQRLGYLLVGSGPDQVRGIVTDRDLRKVVAQGLDLEGPVSTVMSAPVQTINAHTVCFDGLMEMLRRRVHHLALERNGEVVGVLSGHDLMVIQGTSPLQLFKDIENEDQFEELYDLSRRAPLVVRTLIYEGAKPNNITRLITLINDSILERILTLTLKEMGPPPVPFCWLLMGSEGRREQTFRTDQDNGLLYQDPAGEAEAEQCQQYFRALGLTAVEHLVACGFPRCLGGIMASNPDWCQPFSVWAKSFDKWVLTPNPKEVLLSTIFFDFRPGFGEMELGHRLRARLSRQLRGQDVFFRILARDALTTAPPLTMFRNFVLVKKGEHKNKIDLKTNGLVPIVDFARLMSLRHGIEETNTLERLELVADGGFISHELYTNIRQAYEFQMQLRLLHQQRLDEQGLEPHNFIDPDELTEFDQHTLKEAFAVSSEIKSYLKEAFTLNLG